MQTSTSIADTSDPHPSSAAGTEENLQVGGGQKNKTGRTGFQYRLVGSRVCLEQVWVKVLTQPEGET